MNRRSFAVAICAAGSAAAIGASQEAFALTSEDVPKRYKEDVQEGCEGAVKAIKGWIVALAKRDFDYLEKYLADDFVFTAMPRKMSDGTLTGGMKDKKAFIEQDRHIYNADIRFLGLTARRLGDLVITQVFAHVHEEFRGDLGPDMPAAAEMNKILANGLTMGYASGWRERGGVWQCTSHHILGVVDGDKLGLMNSQKS
jgi:hypothetical protein